MSKTMQELIDFGEGITEIKNATVYWVGEKKLKTYGSDGNNKAGVAHKKGDLISFVDKKGDTQNITYISMRIGDGSINYKDDDGRDNIAEFVEFGDIKWIPEKGAIVDFKLKVEPYNGMKYYKGSYLHSCESPTLQTNNYAALLDAADVVLNALYDLCKLHQLQQSADIILKTHSEQIDLIWPPEEAK